MRWRLNSYIYPQPIFDLGNVGLMTYEFLTFTLLSFLFLFSFFLFFILFRLGCTPFFGSVLQVCLGRLFLFFLGRSFRSVWAVLLLGSIPRSIFIFFGFEYFFFVSPTPINRVALIPCQIQSLRAHYMSVVIPPQKLKPMWWRLNSYIYPQSIFDLGNVGLMSFSHSPYFLFFVSTFKVKILLKIPSFSFIEFYLLSDQTINIFSLPLIFKAD